MTDKRQSHGEQTPQTEAAQADLELQEQEADDAKGGWSGVKGAGKGPDSVTGRFGREKGPDSIKING